MDLNTVNYVKTHEAPICRTCKKSCWNTIDGECESCHLSRYVPKETGVKQDVNYDRLEWYAYILKRAITNREPLTAWDACSSMMGHFNNVYGRSQEREDERHVDSFERKK
jgi:hypothetical protein